MNKLKKVYVNLSSFVYVVPPSECGGHPVSYRLGPSRVYARKVQGVGMELVPQ